MPECVNCGSSAVYVNGECYQCPDCGHISVNEGHITIIEVDWMTLRDPAIGAV